MGGWGSGRTLGRPERECIDDVLEFCADRLRRAGCLASDPSVTAFDGNLDGGTRFAHLLYTEDQIRAPYFDSTQTDRITVEWLACGRGGWKRAYFRCPGNGCGQRALKLYYHRAPIRFRRCHELAYYCQFQPPRWRSLHQLMGLKPMPSRPLLLKLEVREKFPA